MKQIKNIFLSKKHLKRDIVITILSFLVSVTAVRAGNLDSPGSPAATGYTLSDIYTRLTTNAAATEGDHLFSPSADPSSSPRTLQEIYGAIPTIEADKVKSGTNYLGIAGTLLPDGGTADAGNVLGGKTFFGNGQTDWILKTGTMADNGAFALTAGSADQSVTAGYYSGGTLVGDTDLVTGNIKSGITIFGVAGDSNVVNTATGDAIAGNLLSGKKAWVDGSEITGTMADIGQQILTPGTTNQTITLGYHDGTGYVSGDTDLVTGNIRSGVNLFGIDGNANVVNTVTGDAVAGNLLSGKKAWVDGAEITGTADIYTYGDNNATRVLTTATAAGTYNASNLSTATVKKGKDFGVSSTGVYSGYPGTEWSGTAITQSACDAQNPTWYWFADGNGDGDTTDAEDGVCVRATAVTSLSWNGSEQIGAASSITAQAATGGSASTIIKTSAGWTANAYSDMVVKVTAGTASGCWGVVKSNTTDTITVYGSWLSSAYASSCGTPDATSVFGVYTDGFDLYDNSWIGDWTCTGSFPSGAPSWGSYPTSASVGAGAIALATTDCYDGTRDLLPTEASRAVKTGTATGATSTTITDTAQSLNTNAWVGEKVLITGGTGSGGSGRIESNTGTVITVSSWTGGSPGVGSTFAIIYLIPHASYNPTTNIDGDSNDQLNGNNGLLTSEVLNNWKGTRLPTSSDFFGYCGYRNGGSDYESTTGTSTADKTYGNYGGQVGRTDEFLDLSNSGSWEWLSEQNYQTAARLAGTYACSYFTIMSTVATDSAPFSVRNLHFLLDHLAI